MEIAAVVSVILSFAMSGVALYKNIRKIRTEANAEDSAQNLSAQKAEIEGIISRYEEQLKRQSDRFAKLDEARQAEINALEEDVTALRDQEKICQVTLAEVKSELKMLKWKTGTP